MEHQFTSKIIEVLEKEFKDRAQDIFDKSTLLQYLNIKTTSANRGSKARGSFANLYAIYVLVEDYIAKGYADNGNYENYEGVQFSTLFTRQRELPFGSKLQNHAINNRMNEEYKKYFQTSEFIPILRNLDTKRYWINENLLLIKFHDATFNISKSVIDIIDLYVAKKQSAFENFINTCEKLRKIHKSNNAEAESFIYDLLAINVDARIFEIVSFAILKAFYKDHTVFFGFSLDEIEEYNLILYKTGRTNANDGGIDFVMKPLGRFFQVTETLDVKKYFLDIDKIERFPISFVIKSTDSIEDIKKKLENAAKKTYSVREVIQKYMECIEEIINIPILEERLSVILQTGNLHEVLNEIIKQSKVEFNYEEG
ncbi:Uncharacterized protein dnl_55510 [Desulfonema limicola]|uniref:Restriction endonuclease n=1 Tax=Desulfonema limicola TaxID=45656 RepID=A0A975GJ21_9BACT|nr:hypothetical protein [Desulfonema limicola]QTA83157.1 Uncharacterized protein dnl_55510 [Desulfonema limicola]